LTTALGLAADGRVRAAPKLEGLSGISALLFPAMVGVVLRRRRRLRGLAFVALRWLLFIVVILRRLLILAVSILRRGCRHFWGPEEGLLAREREREIPKERRQLSRAKCDR
jgi:hypothetical protein